MGSSKSSSLVFLCVLFTLTLCGQRINFAGQIVDSLGLPLELANVVAVEDSSQYMDGFAIADPEGAFQIKLKANTLYKITVSYLGYEPTQLSIQTSTEDIYEIILLNSQSRTLNEVEVVYQIPVSIRGDTIIYDAESFQTGTERKLEDILENLPGVEVNDDGEIEVEGKAVRKVMVEGEDFFDGDSKLASKNIPANAVDKIEVLRNYSEVSQLSNVTNNDDNVALNIKLKDGKKKFWFGEITAAAGTDERYLIKPKLFYYSPEVSVNVLSDINNTGDVAFSARDYWNFTGGFRSAVRSNLGSSFITSASSQGLALTQNNRAQNIDSKFGALNVSYKPNDHWKLSGYGIYSYTGTLIREQTLRTYITSEEQEQITNNIDQNSKLGLAQISTRFTPNQNLQLEYELQARLSDEDEINNSLSMSSITDEIIQNQSQNPITLTQRANLYYTLNDKNIFAMEASYDHIEEDPFYEAIRSAQPFTNLIPFDTSQTRYDIGQNQLTKTNRLDAKLDYFYVTGDKSSLNFTLGTIQSEQRFNSSIFQRLDEGESQNIDGSDFANDVRYHFSDLFTGVHFKFLAGNFTFNPGVHLHVFDIKDEQLGTTNEETNWNLTPDLYINYQFKQSENLRLNYSVTRNYTDINQFARGLVFDNYNSIYRGNRMLESSLYHNLSLNFFSFNMFKLQNVFANVTYSRRMDAFKRNTLIEGINRVGTTINSNLVDETINGMANYQRTFGKIRATTRATLTYSNAYNIVNDIAQNSTSLTQNYSLSASTRFRDLPNLELGYRFNINDYDNSTVSTTYLTDNPFVRFDADFGSGFIFLLDYSFYYYRDRLDSISNKYNNLSASLSYRKPDSQWEFEIEGKNLTDNAVINQDSFNDLYNETSTYFIQPGFVLFKVRYHL